MNVSNKMLLIAENYSGYSFYRFSVIKGKATVGGGGMGWGAGGKTITPGFGLNVSRSSRLSLNYHLLVLIISEL